MDIELRNINKQFGQKVVLSSLSLLIPEGKITCIMGPSGCGKSTLLNLLLHLQTPDSGELIGLEDKVPSVVFQENRLCENIDAIRNIKLVTGTKYSDAEIEREFKMIGLLDDTRKPVSQLSGGMKRRVAILRCLLAESNLCLLDEPFKGLDVSLRSQVIDYVKRTTAGKTVVLVTHDMEEAFELGATILSLTSC